MPGRFAGLAELQREALRELAPDAHGAEGQGAYIPYLKAATELASDHGFAPLGGGSSRFAVEAGELRGVRAVAKLAYTAPGLVHNLQEAIFWLVFPAQVRRYLAPSLALAPSFVLLQERVEVLGPPLLDALELDDLGEQELDRVLKRYEREILEGRRVLGSPAPGEQQKIRLDNYGIRRRGEVVAIDYGEKWKPIAPAWSVVLERLAHGPLSLTGTERARILNASLKSLRAGARADRTRPTLMTFLRQAGVSPAGGERCPCGGDRTYSDCFRLDPDECPAAIDALDYMTLKGLYAMPNLTAPSEQTR
jgi:hypothetical protein